MGAASADVLDAILRRVGAHAGLRPPAWVLAARVRDRMAALGDDDPRAYLRRLDGPRAAGELDALAEALRVGETRFFRHAAHVRAVERVVVPALRGRAQVRVWSAGCASGEEAWSLAAQLVDGLGERADVSVLATDISDEALAVARAGVYPEAALRSAPEGLRRLFVPGRAPGTIEPGPLLRARVRFVRHNLHGDGYPHKLDVIFCRNVLIYFDAEHRRRAAERLVSALSPGGFLFLGYAETLRDVGGLTAERTEDGVVYRRDAVPPAPARRRDAGTGALADKRPPAPLALAFPARRGPIVVALSGDVEEPERVARALSEAMREPGEGVTVELDGASFLADGVATVLRRAAAAAAAAGTRFEILAGRAGTRRWLERHGLA